ncbi:sensor histidine kinase [Pedobacter frigiditerrae]|uniref:tetratricopeptide repeat-containing sensor histidine kinase n=1 Tax=Pedobacter frigiditerrae TaxID=2530452 RepID=UPI002930F277|nr:sensor histidine kinase [Pedobacter frigiditerrae]
MALQQLPFIKCKVLAIVFLVFSLSSIAFAQSAKTNAQTSNIDSLIAQVPGLMRSDKKLALQKMQQIQVLSTKANYKHGLIESAFFRSWLTYRYGSADACIKSIDSAIKNIPNISSDAAEVKFYILKGQCYVKKTQFDQAVNNFSTAIKIAERKKDFASKTGALISVGWAYMEDSKPKEAIGFFTEVLTLNPEKTYSNRALVLCNIAACYNILANYTAAERYALQGVEAARASGSMVDLANGLNILARSNYQRGKFDKAIVYLKEASKAREKVEDPAMLASDYLELADVYLKTKQADQAILYAKKAEAISYVNKIDLKLANSYEALAGGFTAIGDYKNAARYYQKLLAHKDSTGTGNYSKALAELQVKFATEKKVTENLKLKKENLESKLSISNKQKWLTILIAGLLGVVATALYIFYLTRSKYRTQRALEQLNEQRNKTLAVMQTEESERRRIAGDLHDGVCQMLVAASLQLKNAKGDEEKLAKIDDLLDQATAEVRAVSHQMTPELLLHYGLLMAVQQGIERLNDAQNKCKFTLFEHVEFEDVDEMLAVVMYRAFQELTNNVLKHANATEVSVHLIINEEEALLMIEDNGEGFDSKTNKFGLGLKNLESRIKLYGGSLNIDTMLGKGTTSILKFTSPTRKNVLV